MCNRGNTGKSGLIEIDGGYGEGGGQLLRTSLALSAMTGKPMRIYDIRANRKPPGLKIQHLMSAESTARISSGRLIGGKLGARELTFYPGPIQGGDYIFDISSLGASAGSVSLIFQTLLLPLGFTKEASHITLKGGTHVAWSPPADYIRDIFLPTLAPLGAQAKLKILRWGFYPIGGGILHLDVSPFQTPLKPLRIEQRGALRSVRLFSVVANLPLSIAERQLHQMMARLAEAGLQPAGESLSVESPGKGTFCFILTEFEQVRAGFSALGEIGKRAERVADEAAEAFLQYWNREGALDSHLADQVAPYMALAEGESVATVAEVTPHLRTHIWVIEQFLPVRFILKENPSGGGRILVKGRF